MAKKALKLEMAYSLLENSCLLSGLWLIDRIISPAMTGEQIFLMPHKPPLLTQEAQRAIWDRHNAHAKVSTSEALYLYGNLPYPQ